MGILDAFGDWQVVSAQYKQVQTTKDSAGQVTTALVDVGTPFDCWKWIDSSNEIDLNNAFVGDEIGTIVIEPSTAPTTPKRGDVIVADGSEYKIIGVDDSILELEEVILIKYRRAYDER